MKKLSLASGLAVVMLSSVAVASVSSIKGMKDQSLVNITGTVQSVQNERKFTLHDSTGDIDVNITSDESVVLKEGDSVTVTGNLDKGWFITDINANKVAVNKSLGKVIGEAVEANTPFSLEGATAYNIENLPESGLVKVTGRVISVSNEKKFTLKDPTGSIDVEVISAQSAVITEGIQVTVVGNVKSSMTGKTINAEKVFIVSDSAPMAGTPDNQNYK